MKVRLTKKNVRGKSTGKGKGSCGLILCIDPKTGAVQLEAEGKCPKGYIRKINEGFRKGVILPKED